MPRKICNALQGGRGKQGCYNSQKIDRKSFYISSAKRERENLEDFFATFQEFVCEIAKKNLALFIGNIFTIGYKGGGGGGGQALVLQFM
jgi:hypothetical protein